MGEEIHPAKAPLPGEPNAYTGGKQEPGGLVPPYEGRQTEGPSGEPQAGQGSMAGPREVSQAEREGLTSTDPNPEGPLSGVSKSKQGNERMYGRSEEAHRADQTDIGVGGEPKTTDPESPGMVVGDQGG
ncbi:MAG TPA: hypothetical protein VFO16_04750 [Pseudonocardiaceae bacterium]|nr:hypothetical protein [Pseudonocardiaceae bacterium]